MKSNQQSPGAELPPSIDVDAVWAEYERRCAAVEQVFRRVLDLGTEVDLTSYGQNYAMYAMPGSPSNPRSAPPPTDQKRKRELSRVARHARSAIEGTDPRAMGNLILACRDILQLAMTTPAEVKRAEAEMERVGFAAGSRVPHPLPEAMMALIEMPDPSCETLENLAAAAEALAALVPLPDRRHAGTGRPWRPDLHSMALAVLSDFSELSGRIASIGRGSVDGSDFVILLREILATLSIDANAIYWARTAIEARKKAIEDREKTLAAQRMAGQEKLSK